MKLNQRLLTGLAALAVGFVLVWSPAPAPAYVEAPMSLGAVIAQSSVICLMRVEKVDKEKNLIIYSKIQDIKGKHPTDQIKHQIGRGGFHPREWQYPMEWAEVGKTAVFFSNGGASETCIGNYWYQAYAGGEWWNMSHGEPFLLRSFAGKPEKLVAIVTEVNAGRETLAPCMIDGNKDDLHLRRAKIQRLKVSLKLQDYNPKRDFVGWGGEDFARINGMPGFTHYCSLSRVDPEAQAISSVDIDSDGKPDLCLVGGGRAVLLQNAGESMNEISLPGTSGCRAAVWADYNGDGKPDLFLATLTGPKLFTNQGQGKFQDDSHLLPREPCYDLTAAAWLDYDSDGKPDLLLGNGFHGLRLYRNKGAVAGKQSLGLGKWHHIGPFDNAGMRGFDAAYPPEKEIDLKKTYKGTGNVDCAWKVGDFTDGQPNNLLTLFQQNQEAVVYLYREIDTDRAMDLPCSFGSDDTLTVWLNGQRLIAENVYRGVAADQSQAVLKLKAGKNQLLIKICQGGGDWAFYFQAKANIPAAVTWAFEDVSTEAGLGPDGIGGAVKGDTLTVSDVNGDGKPDFLYGAANGILVLNTGKGLSQSKDSGISFKPGKVGPVFGDFDGDGQPDLFVPQSGGCKLFKSNGKGKFTDVTAKTGDLAKLNALATSAAWGDVDNDGHLDLVVGCLRGPNRFFRNKGDGSFEDASELLGLQQRIFNSQAICLVDLQNRGVLDMVFNNEGQESAVLLANPETLKAKKTPVSMQVAGTAGVVGSKVQVRDMQGKVLAEQFICGGDGRGGQRAPIARFALAPGTYKVEVRYSSGLVRATQITVADAHVKGVINDETPRVN